ncbi:MAG: hypothetical protein J6V09_03650, partial [Clostridia bacterium]|nr:hypothetical protein [Clostridia bacterium]
MKIRKISGIVLSLALAIATLLTLSSCMKEEDYYTKTDVDSFVAELQAALATKESQMNAAIDALKADYGTKISALETENEARKSEISELTATYNAKVEALEKADADNAAAILALQAEAATALGKLENKISQNEAKIASLEAELDTEISTVRAEFNTKVANINELISALETENLSNKERIEILEAQITALLSIHQHTFYGAWTEYVITDKANCENRLYYRTCSECGVLEFKKGDYDDHQFDTVTVEPTCASQGYDHNTCLLCGFEEKDNFKAATSNHTQGEEYRCSVCGSYVPIFVAKDVLYDMYKVTVNTPDDYEVVSRIKTDDGTFAVTWQANNTDNVKLNQPENEKVKVEITPKKTKDVSYTLTATIADSNGATVQVSFDLVIPYNNLGNYKLDVGVAYKYYISHVGLDKVLFFNGKMDGDYLGVTEDPALAPDVFVEEAEGGVRFYFMD